jgi:uncharacterized protein (TIGR02996 family)
MTPEQAFLQGIREAATEDTPRLIFADWLEEHGQADRAEFIRVQCRLAHMARMPETETQRLTLLRRAEELLRNHWQEWVGPIRKIVGGQSSRYGGEWLREAYHPDGLQEFRRGFVESLALDAESYLEHAGELQRLAPLTELRLWGAGRCAARLAQEATLRGLAFLGFMDYYVAPLMAKDMALLAASPYLGNVTVLYLGRNSIGDEGVEALAQAPWLMSVRSLDLTDNGLSDRGARALAQSPHVVNLRALHLRRNAFTRAGIDALTSSPNLRRIMRLEYDPAPGNLLM